MVLISVAAGAAETATAAPAVLSCFRELGRGRFSRGEEVSNQRTDGDRVAGSRSRGGNPEDSRVTRFDVLGRLLPLQGEERIAGADGFAILLEPADEDPLLHVPAEPGDGDRDGHGVGLTPG